MTMDFVFHMRFIKQDFPTTRYFWINSYPLKTLKHHDVKMKRPLLLLYKETYLYIEFKYETGNRALLVKGPQ